MIQYNFSNLKLSKSAIKNETGAVLRLSSNMVGTILMRKLIFHIKLLFTNRQVANFS